MDYDLNKISSYFADLFVKNQSFKVSLNGVHYGAATEEFIAAKGDRLAMNQYSRTPLQFALEELFQRCYPMYRFVVLPHIERDRFMIYRMGIDAKVSTFLVEISKSTHALLHKAWGNSLKKDQSYNFFEMPHEVEIQPLWEVTFQEVV